MFHVRQFRKIVKVNIEKPDALFCEFYGMLLGDGCITDYKDNYMKVRRIAIIIVCNKSLDSIYLKNWKKALFHRYSLNAYYYENEKDNSCRLTIRNKDFCLQLHKRFGVPIGYKYEKLKISPALLQQSWNVKKYIIRGLFDTDGILFARKDENYKYPHISITSKSNSFLRQLKRMLRNQGYPAYINGVDIRIKGIKNVKKWFEDIGSSNPRNLKKYEYFLKNGVIPPQSKGLW